jgi:hypothetical protein
MRAVIPSKGKNPPLFGIMPKINEQKAKKGGLNANKNTIYHARTGANWDKIQTPKNGAYF